MSESQEGYRLSTPSSAEPLHISRSKILRYYERCPSPCSNENKLPSGSTILVLFCCNCIEAGMHKIHLACIGNILLESNLFTLPFSPSDLKGKSSPSKSTGRGECRDLPKTFYLPAAGIWRRVCKISTCVTSDIKLPSRFPYHWALQHQVEPHEIACLRSITYRETKCRARPKACCYVYISRACKKSTESLTRAASTSPLAFLRKPAFILSGSGNEERSAETLEELDCCMPFALLMYSAAIVRTHSLDASWNT